MSQIPYHDDLEKPFLQGLESDHRTEQQLEQSPILEQAKILGYNPRIEKYIRVQDYLTRKVEQYGQPDYWFYSYRTGYILYWKDEQTPDFAKTFKLRNHRNQVVEAKANLQGFPICPHCDEDELWSPYIPKPGEERSLAAMLRAGLSCYRCNSKFQWVED